MITLNASKFRGVEEKKRITSCWVGMFFGRFFLLFFFVFFLRRRGIGINGHGVLFFGGFEKLDFFGEGQQEEKERVCGGLFVVKETRKRRKKKKKKKS